MRRSFSLTKIWNGRTDPRGQIREIPTRNGLPFFGTTFSIIAAGSAPKLHEYIDGRHRESGPVFRENMGNDTAIFVSDPETMRFVFAAEGKYPKHFMPKAWNLYNKLYECKRGLFFMDGEEWLSHRKPLNKHFLKKDVIENLSQVHDAVVSDLVERWRFFEGSQIKNLEHEFYHHSLSFVIGSLLGSNYIEKRGEYSEDISKLADIFQLIFETSSKLTMLPVGLAQRLGLNSWKQFETAVRHSLESSRKMVRKMASQRSSDGLLDKMIEENIKFDRAVAIVADLLLAAGDTTAYASQWALYLLSKNEKCQEEILNNPELTRGSVRETLRLYPPAIFITRYLPETVSFKGYTFNKDELIILSLYTAGRNEAVYPNPDSFDPKRWLRNGAKLEGVTHLNSFLPFAMGIRSCIGAKLAQSMMTKTIQKIVQSYRLTLEEEVQMRLKLVPVPEKPIKIKLKYRS